MFGEIIFAQSLFATSSAVKKWQEMCAKVTGWVEISAAQDISQSLSKVSSDWAEINKSVILTNKCSN
jgi:hypothetical protein